MKTRKAISILSGIIILSGAAAFGQGALEPRQGMDRPDRPVLDPVIAELRVQLTALQAELAEARRDLALSLEGLTDEERSAAIAAFRESHTELVGDIRDLTLEIREAAAEYRPTPPERPEVPDELISARRELAALRAELAQSRAAVLRELGDAATREEIMEALAAWREENAGKLAEAEELKSVIEAWFADNRPGARGPRPDADPELLERRVAFQERAQEMRQERALLREELRGASQAEREEAIQTFRKQQRELMEERRELRRLERVGGLPGGDRRPGG